MSGAAYRDQELLLLISHQKQALTMCCNISHLHNKEEWLQDVN